MPKRLWLLLTLNRESVSILIPGRATTRGPRAIQPFSDEFSLNRPRLPQKDVQGFAVDYKAVVNNVDVSQPDMLAAAAGKIETF